MIGYFRYIPKYTMVSLFCAAVHNAILIATDHLGFGVLACQTASAIVLMPLGFLLQSRFTFRVERSWFGFVRYSAALMTNFPLVVLSLWLTRNQLAVPMWVAGPVSTIVLYLWNYTTSRWALTMQPSMDGKEVAHD